MFGLVHDWVVGVMMVDVQEAGPCKLVGRRQLKGSKLKIKEFTSKARTQLNGPIGC